MPNIDLPEKLYYSINEVAQAFGVNASLIRFWEKEFEIISPRKTTSGSRKFSADDIQKLKLIYHLVKERGFTLEGARQRLKEEKQKTLDNFALIEKLEHIKQTLINIKESLGEWNIIDWKIIITFAKNIRIMSVAVLLQEPEVLTDKKGNSFRLIPEEEYNYMLNVISMYEEDDLTEEDVRKIAISKEQSKLGMTSKSEDVFKRIQEKRGKHYRNPSL